MRPEDFAEIAEAAKSHGGRDLGDGPVIVLQQKLCLLNAVNAQVILEAMAKGSAEQAAEMAGTHVKVAGGIGGCDAFGVMGRNKVCDVVANTLFCGKVGGTQVAVFFQHAEQNGKIATDLQFPTGLLGGMGGKGSADTVAIPICIGNDGGYDDAAAFQTRLQAMVVQQRKIKAQTDVWISFDRREKNGLPVSVPGLAGRADQGLLR